MNKNTPYTFLMEKWGGWLAVGLFVAIPLVRWAQLGILSDRFASVSTSILSLGRIAGIAGFMFFALNFVLAIRARWLEGFFGGLNRVYIAHHVIGGIALVLILFHPVFLALRYIDITMISTVREAAKFLLPRLPHFSEGYAVVQDEIAVNNGILAFTALVTLLYVAFFVKLPYRLWLVTHKFIGIAFVLAGLHVIFVASDVYRDPFLKWYFIAWAVLGVVAYGYRTLMSNVFVRRARYRVQGVRILEKNVVGVAMTPVDKPVDFRPGQFVFIRFNGVDDLGISREAHPFSIASSPNEPEGTMYLYMKALGDFTNSLRKLPEGTIAEIEGAFGRFIPSRYVRTPQIWIAGGIGITPFLSAARTYDANHPPVDLFYSVVSRSELLDQAALASFVPTHYPQFKFHDFVGDEKQQFLSADYVLQTLGDVSGREIFICGPPPMMKALREQFVKRGVPNSKIHTEEFALT